MFKEEITFEKMPQAISYIVQEIEQIKQMLAELPRQELIKRELIDIEEASLVIKKAKSTIYTLVRNGAIPAYKRGKKLYFFEAELMDWIASNKTHKVLYSMQDLEDQMNKKHKRKPTSFSM